jgi:hemoglobin-like flavoprotein
MGGGASSTSRTNSLEDFGDTPSERINAMMPAFFKPNSVVSPRDLASAKISWSMIVEDTSPEFIRLSCRAEGFEYSSCQTWFIDQIFVNIAESGRMPTQLHMATSKVRERAIRGMVEMLLSVYEDKTQEERLEAIHQLAIVHSRSRGVRAYQYAPIGTMFLLTMKQCLGDGYGEDVDAAWIRIFSATFEVLIPTAIEIETRVT